MTEGIQNLALSPSTKRVSPSACGNAPGTISAPQIYLWGKDKIPFVGTELEQLALPAELREPLRKKKVLL